MTKFYSILPGSQSDLAEKLIKDPYNFEFLGLDTDISERQLERALVNRVGEFLLELGRGCEFVGQQYDLEVGG